MIVDTDYFINWIKDLLCGIKVLVLVKLR